MAQRKLEDKESAAHRPSNYDFVPGELGESVHRPVLELCEGHPATIVQDNHRRLPSIEHLDAGGRRAGLDEQQTHTLGVGDKRNMFIKSHANAQPTIRISTVLAPGFLAVADRELSISSASAYAGKRTGNSVTPSLRHGHLGNCAIARRRTHPMDSGPRWRSTRTGRP